MNRALRLAVVAVLAVYPVIVAAGALRGGIGLSQDSVSYLAGAQSFGRGEGIRTFTGDPLTLFPPGLPALLGLAEAAGASARTAAMILNLVCLPLVVVGTYALGRVARLGAWGGVIAAAIVSLSTSFVGVFAWLWTEPLFTVLVLSLLVVMASCVRAQVSSWQVIAGAGLLVALATSVRYVGLTLIPAVAVGIWLASADRGRRSAWARAGSATLVACVGPALVAWRNLDAGAGPFGDRVPGSRTMEGAFVDLVSVIGAFLLPSDSSMLSPVLGVCALLLVAGGAWLAWAHRDRVMLVLAVFVIVYGLSMVWSQATTRLDAPSARLLAPALPAMAVLGVYAGHRVLRVARRQVVDWACASPTEGVRSRAQQLGSVIPGALVVLVGGVLAVASVLAAQRLWSDGPGESLETRAELSALIPAIGSLPGGGIATNDPWTVYLGVGTPPVLPLPPDPKDWPADRVASDTEAVVNAVQRGDVAYAVVFSDAEPVQPLDELVEKGLTVERALETEEGTVYRLTATR